MSTEADKLAYRMDEAAKAVGVSTDTLYRLVAREELRTFKIGARTLIARDELVALIERRRAA